MTIPPPVPGSFPSDVKGELRKPTQQCPGYRGLQVACPRSTPDFGTRKLMRQCVVCGFTVLASYPGLLTQPVLTQGRPGKTDHMQRYTWTCGGVAHSFSTAVQQLSEPKKHHQDCLIQALSRFSIRVCNQ